MTRNKLIALGMLYMLFGAFFFSLMNAVLKILSTHITIFENLLFRGLTMGLFVILIMSLRKKRRKKTHKILTPNDYIKLISRAAFGSFSLLMLLYNVATIPLGTSVAFSQSTPIYTIILAWLILREKMSLAMIFGVAIGFLGVILLSNPTTDNLSPLNILLGICGGIFASLAFITIRSLRGTFDNLTILLSFGAFSAILGLILSLIFQKGFSPLGFNEVIFIALVGVTGTLGQFFLTRAYTFAPAQIIAPIDYTMIIFSTILGILLGDSIPDFVSVMGICLIIACGLIAATPIIIKEFRKHKGA